jgi:tetratricopeptide (TPR) repeat protein
MRGDEGTPVQRVVSSQLAGSEGIVDESWASASSPLPPPPHLSRRGSKRTKSHSLHTTASGNRDDSDAAAGDGDGDGTSGKRNAATGENVQGTESESQEKGWGMDYGGISGKSGVGSGRKFAEVAYRKALESNPGDVDTIYRYASYLHTVKGDGKGAHSLYAKALSLDPLHLSSLSKMGKLISDETGDSKAAERLFCRALMVDPGHVPVLLDRAYLKWRAVGDLGGAADLFQKAIDLDGDGEFVDVGVLCAFAGLLEDKGELERAEGMYERAIAWDGQHVTSLFNYGLMLEEGLKEHGRASQMYRRVLELDPSHFFTLANYGGLLDSVIHDYDAAEELYKRALGIQPNDAATLHNYAGKFRSSLCHDNAV